MNSRTRIITLLLTLALCFVMGCGKSGQVHVTKGIDAKLSDYPAVHIAASGKTAKTNKAARKFERILGERLKEEGVFREVDSSADLVLRCKVTHMEFGDELKRELSLKGKSKVTIEIRITEPDGTLLGHITATAQTTRKNNDDQPAVRVLEMAADAVVKYMLERSGKDTSKKAKSSGKKQSKKPSGSSETDGGDGTKDDNASDDNASDDNASDEEESPGNESDEDEDEF